jgi:hypothetical protein
VKYHLVKKLLPVKVDAAAADLTPEDGDAVALAIVHIYVLVHVLVTANADIRLGWGQQKKTFHVEARQGVIQ